MKIKLLFISLMLIMAGIAHAINVNGKENLYLGEQAPFNIPKEFKSELIPDSQLAHAGVFTPDMDEYYFTLSDASFSQFDVMYVAKVGQQWSPPKKAFFNSAYSEHGVHFTRDGQWLYFSSTRPIANNRDLQNWHIWRSKKQKDGWGKAEFVDIPGLEGRSVSHPSLSQSGRLYFHSSKPDYSDMTLFVTEEIDGVFQPAKKVILPDEQNQNAITPFIAQDESYLLYAKLLKDGEELYVSRRENDVWQRPVRLNEKINDNNLGNPYVTADGKYLFYAAARADNDATPARWVIKWVRIDEVLKR